MNFFFLIVILDCLPVEHIKRLEKCYRGQSAFEVHPEISHDSPLFLTFWVWCILQMSFGETKANIVWGHTCLFKRAFSLRSVMGCFTLPSVLNSLPDDGEISVGGEKKLLGHLMTFLEYWRQNVMFTLLVVPSENSSSVFVRFNTS